MKVKQRGFFWVLAGGVLAAGTAVLCCLGPVLAVGLGLGSFTAAAWFAEWRPVLLGITFVLLGLAWYLTCRRPKAGCADGSCPRPPGRMVRVSLWIGTIVALAAAGYPWLAALGRCLVPADRAGAPPVAVAAGEAAFSVLVPSMDCAPCAAGIAASLQRVAGVKQATVDYDTRRAVLVYDPAVTSRDQLLAWIDRTGFPADRSTLK